MRGVTGNWNEQVKILRLEFDQDKVRALGVTSLTIAQASRAIFSGSTVGQYRQGDRLIDIVLRQPAEERNAITHLGNAYLPTPSGRSVPLAQVAKVGFTWEPDVLPREGGSYAVTVLSDVVEGLQAPTVTAQVWPKLQELAAKMPPGDTVQIAGAVKESSKGQGSLLANVPLMALIIVNLLMLQLQSFSRARLVMLATGHCRRGGGAADPEPALRICSTSGLHCAGGHDDAQFGDPDRPDRAG